MRWGGYGLKLALSGAALALRMSLISYFCCSSLPEEKSRAVLRKIVNGNKQPSSLALPRRKGLSLNSCLNVKRVGSALGLGLELGIGPL